MSEEPQEVIDWWALTSGLTLGPLVPNKEALTRVKRLLYTYQDINAIELH